jgi:hypothetical protein
MQKRELNPATPRNQGQVNTSIAGGQNPHLVPRNFSRAIRLREGLQVPCESYTYVWARPLQRVRYAGESAGNDGGLKNEMRA